MKYLPFIAVLCFLLFASATTEDDKPPKITNLMFGTINVNGKTYEKDLVISKGVVSEHKKGPSRPQHADHAPPLTPLELYHGIAKHL